MRLFSLTLLLALLVALALAQESTSAAESAASSPVASASDITDEEPSQTPEPTASDDPTDTTTGIGSAPSNGDLGPPDVHLKVPELSVGRIELDVDNLQADINLHAQVARLVEINAGVQVSVEKVNITIADVEAELELVVRLGHLVEIVNRTLASLDLNPALVNLLDSVTDLAGAVVGAVDGLIGSITQGDGGRLNFLIDNLGNIVQEVVGAGGDAVSTIVGNWRENMTATGQERNLDGGMIERTFSYEPLDALVNIVFNSLNQIVQATVVRGGGSDDGDDEGDETATSSAAPSATNLR